MFLPTTNRYLKHVLHCHILGQAESQGQTYDGLNYSIFVQAQAILFVIDAQEGVCQALVLKKDV